MDAFPYVLWVLLPEATRHASDSEKAFSPSFDAGQNDRSMESKMSLAGQ